MAEKMVLKVATGREVRGWSEVGRRGFSSLLHLNC